MFCQNIFALFLVAYVAIVEGVFVKEDGVTKDVLNMCKNKFPVSEELLERVHKSGLLPDNADENIMCFNECFMTGVGILKNGELDKDNTSTNIGELLKKRGITDVKSIMANILACGSEGGGLEKCAKSYAIINVLTAL